MAQMMMKRGKINGKMREPGEVLSDDDAVSGLPLRNLKSMGFINEVPDEQIKASVEKMDSDESDNANTMSVADSKRYIETTGDDEDGIEALLALKEREEARDSSRDSVLEAIVTRHDNILKTMEEQADQKRASAPDPDDKDTFPNVKSFGEWAQSQEDWIVVDEVMAKEQKGENRSGAIKALEARLLQIMPESLKEEGDTAQDGDAE